MNWRRMALGGTIAGLVLNIAGMVSAVLMALPETFARYGVAPTAGTALLHIALRMLLGFACVLLYAGVRRTWRPGPGSALRVALIVWFVGYVPGTAVLHELGVLSNWQFGFALVWGVLEVALATVAGARAYRDTDPSL